VLVAAANDCEGVFGSRMIGAGFGGCVLSVTDARDTVKAAAEIRASYEAVTGQEPWQHIAEPAEPAQVVSGT